MNVYYGFQILIRETFSLCSCEVKVERKQRFSPDGVYVCSTCWLCSHLWLILLRLTLTEQDLY